MSKSYPTYAAPLSDNARVLITEHIVPGPDAPHFSKLFDIHVMCWGTGRERTDEEYAQLPDSAGWQYARTWYPSNRLIGVIEAEQAAGLGPRNTALVMVETSPDRWAALWSDLSLLQDYARRLRHLSHEEPLAQHNPAYPKAGLGRSHADEVRDVLSGIQRTLEKIREEVPSVLSAAAPAPGIAADERPDETARRLDALSRLAESLARQAFEPLPPLPPHAPPYLFEPPGHDLAGTKAVLLAIGIERVTTSLRNLLLAAANRTSSG